MGLYDGLGGIKAEGSAYDLACTLKMPVVLIVDAHGMGRSLLPLIAGFLHYDVEKWICGVILNRVSGELLSDNRAGDRGRIKRPGVWIFPECERSKDREPPSGA